MPSERQQKFNRATPEQLDRVAQQMGFPSARALGTIIELGAHLKGGGRITEEWVGRVHKAYPALSREQINVYATNVHTVDDLAKTVGVDPAQAHAYVDKYETQAYVDAIQARSERHVDRFKGDMPEATNPSVKNSSNYDATRWLKIAEQFPPEPADFRKSLPPHVRREVVAQGLDKVQAARRALDEIYEYEKRDPDVGRFATERSLHNDIRAAFNANEFETEASEILGDKDIDSVQQQEDNSGR